MVESTETVPGSRKRPWVVMGVALAIVAVVFGGSLLVNALLPGKQPVRAGEEVLLDETQEYQASLVLSEDGWVRDLDSRKLAGDNQRFLRGPLELEAMPVTLAGDTAADDDRLWEGLGDILRTKDSEVSLGDPSPITSDEGVEGLTGAVEGGENDAVAVLYSAPDGRSAVHMVLSSRAESADVDEVIDTVSRSVAFTDKGEDA